METPLHPDSQFTLDNPETERWEKRNKEIVSEFLDSITRGAKLKHNRIYGQTNRTI